MVVSVYLVLSASPGESVTSYLVGVIGRIAKDPRFERLPCVHKGTYADDCIVERVTQVSLCDHVIVVFLKGF